MLYASDAWCCAGFTDSDMKPFLAPSLRRPLSPFFMLFSPFLSAVAISGRWFFIIACRHLLTNVFLCLTLYLLFCYCSSQNTNMINTVFKMLTIMFFSGLSCALRTWSTCWTRRQPTSMRCWRSPSSLIYNIIAIIPSSSSPLSSSSVVYYIIASSQTSSSSSSEYFRWSATYRQGKRASTSKAWKSATCDQTARIRKRRPLIEIWKSATCDHTASEKEEL